MFQTCRISWQDVTRSDKYSLLSYVVFSCSSTLIARNLRAQHHISGKTTFCTLCAPTHKVQESCLPGSEGGAKLPSSLPLSNPSPSADCEDCARFNCALLAAEGKAAPVFIRPPLRSQRLHLRKSWRLATGRRCARAVAQNPR